MYALAAEDAQRPAPPRPRTGSSGRHLRVRSVRASPPPSSKARLAGMRSQEPQRTFGPRSPVGGGHPPGHAILHPHTGYRRGTKGMKATTISRAILGMAVLAALVVPVTTAGLLGMNGSQIICGRGGADRINGGKGSDIIYGGLGDDVLTTGKGGATEAAYGGPGNDVLKDFASGQSPGLLVGGPGRDRCIGDKHDTFRRCEVIKLRPHWE